MCVHPATQQTLGNRRRSAYLEATENPDQKVIFHGKLVHDFMLSGMPIRRDEVVFIKKVVRISPEVVFIEKVVQMSPV